MHSTLENLWKNISTQYILGIIYWISILRYALCIHYFTCSSPNTSHQPYWLNISIQDGDWEQTDENTDLLFKFWKMCTSAQTTPDLSIKETCIWTWNVSLARFLHLDLYIQLLCDISLISVISNPTWFNLYPQAQNLIVLLTSSSLMMASHTF